MKITVRELTGERREWVYSPRRDVDVDTAISTAFKKAFGPRWYFLQDSGLPRGYGNAAKNTPHGTMVGARVRVDVE